MYRQALVLTAFSIFSACNPAPGAVRDDATVEQGLDAGADASVEGLGGDARLDGTVPDHGEDLGEDLGGDALTDGGMQSDADAPAPPPHASCSSPELVVLTNGIAVVSDDTRGAADEFAQVSCGNPLGPWPGPQVYYRVTLTGGKTYRLVLTPTGSGFDGALYAFPASTACGGAAIDLACAGHSADAVGVPAIDVLTLTPSSTEDWIVVVDAYDATEAGPFTLRIEEIVPPANTTCAQAAPLAVGPTGVQGDTSLSQDEFASVSCQHPLGPWAGPQLYYEVKLTGGKHYKATLTPAGPGFDAALYAFPSTTPCAASLINLDCGGHAADLSGIGTEVLLLSPAGGGSWKLVVDAWSQTVAGPFSLTVEEVTLPTHTRCAQAKTVTLSGGQATINGDTALSSDEFPTLECASGVPFAGPQLYYRANLTPGKTYRLRLKPSFEAALHVFSTQTCSAFAIEGDCGAGGIGGDMIWLTAGRAMDLLFSPSSAQTSLSVDSAHGYGGPFTLEISEATPPTFVAPFNFDFESGCQGLLATNDWECGTPAFVAGPGCDKAATAPAAAHSGKTVWGTQLGGCSTPFGNNVGIGPTGCANAAPNDDSILRFKVLLSGGTKATLSYWSWEDILHPDWAEVRVNGAAVPATQLCKATHVEPTAWIKREVDLSAQLGKTVEISFHLLASSLTNHAGWYIDDLAVSTQ